MEEKTINKMSKSELLALVISIIGDINKISAYSGQIETIMTQIKEANGIINGDESKEISGLLEQIQTTEVNANEKMERIQATYELIMGNEKEAEEGEEPRKSILSQLKALLDEYKSHRDDIENFSDEVFGYENSEGQPVEGLQGKLKKLLKEQEEKYKEFFDTINKELSAGTTSLKLALTFSNKVFWYKLESNLWVLVFISLLSIVIYFGYTGDDFSNFLLSYKGGLVNDYTTYFVYRLYRLPIISAIIWLAVFISNRRAEAKKLEESYKHKEVMARSYIGYKDSIEQLQKEMGTEDFSLLAKHMDNLLDSIATDSSKFLIEKGEKHPFIDMMEKALSKTKLPKSVDELMGKYSVTAEFKKE